MTAAREAQSRLADRFWSKVDRRRPHECWPWLRYTDGNGYGRFSLGGRTGRMEMAHRVAWLLTRGELPARPLELDHLCRRRACVNPGHMEVVTHAENSRRSTAGEVNATRQRAITQCPHGHDYEGDNTGFTASGRRRCRSCDRARSRRWAAANRGRRERVA